MIGRRTTRTLAELYCCLFSLSHRSHDNEPDGPAGPEVLDSRALHDFLYDHGWQPWLLKVIVPLSSRTELRDFLLNLHTGESMSVYPDPLPRSEWSKIGQTLLEQLAEDVLKWAESPDAPLGEEHAGGLAELRQLLELDGYEWDGRKLYASESELLETGDTQGVVYRLLNELELGKREGLDRHLEHSLNYYIGGQWTESIGHSRKFLESVLREIAAKHHLTTSGAPLATRTYTRPEAVLEYVQEAGLLDAGEAVTIRAAYTLLKQAAGSNPFPSAQDRARLLRRLALALAEYVLLRAKAVIPEG